VAKGILRIKVLGDATHLNSTLTQTSGLLSKFGGIAGTAALGIAGAVAGAAAGIGKFAFDSAQNFDQAMDTIRVGTGATGETLADLGESFRAVFTNVPASAEDVGVAIADLNTRTGATGDQLETLAQKSVLLSKITGEDLSGQIAAVTRVFGDWGISAKDQAGAMDYLFKASQSTGIGVSELSEKVVQYGAPMRQLGFTFEETAALMGKFEKEGVNLDTVMAGMRKGLATFAKAGEAPAEALERATEAIKNAGSQADANALAIQIFGARAGPDMAAAIREGRFEVGELLSTLEASPETINGAAEATYDFGERWAMVKNKLADALEPLGTWMMDVLENLAVVVSEGLAKITAFWDEHGATIMSIVTVVWGIIESIVKAAMGIIEGIIKVVMGIITGDWSLAWEGVKQIFGSIWDGMLGIWNAAKGWILAIPGAIKGAFAGAGSWLLDKGQAVMQGLWDGLKSIWASVSGWFAGLPGKIKGFFVGAGSWLWNIGASIMQGLWDGLLSVFREIESWFKSIGGWFKSWKGPIEKDRRLLMPEGQAVMEGLAAGLESGIPEVKNLLTGLTDELTVAPGTVVGAGVGAAVGVAAAGTAGDTSRVLSLLERIARAVEAGRGDIIIHADTAAGGEAAGDAFLRRVALGGYLA